MHIDGSLGNLMQGVSQQPNRDRKPGQCTAQLNAMADIVDGWKRRPPTLDAVPITLADTTQYKWHFHDTGLEQYIIAAAKTAIGVIDREGVLQTLEAPANAFDYITTDNPSADIQFTTIGDYTIVVNKNIVPAMLPTVDPYVSGAILYFTSSGEHRQRFSVNYKDVDIAHQIGPSATSSDLGDAEWFNLPKNIESLETQLIANTTVDVWRSNILLLVRHVEPNDHLPVPVSVHDGHAQDTTAYVIQDTIRKADMLPLHGLPHQVVAVTGDGSNEVDDYYLKFEPNPGLTEQFGVAGVWKETRKHGITYEIDPKTMPHVIVRLPDGTFYFGPLDGTTHAGYTLETWGTRNSGNELTNPLPAFIGKPINNVGVFQERMYILSGDTVNFSSTRGYFDFFYETALDILDSDPVEMVAPDEKVASLEHGMQHNTNLILFTKFAQFVIRGTQALTPATAQMALTTSFETDLTCAPAPGGDTIFFPISYGAFAGIQEFYTSSEVESNNAHAITEHVKRYIPGHLTQIASNNRLGMLVCRSSEKPSSLFIYQYMWEQTTRVQAAWGEWELAGNIRGVLWTETSLLVVMEHSGMTWLTTIDMTDPVIEGIGYNIYLDGRKKYTPDVHNRITVPGIASEAVAYGNTFVVVQAENGDNPGLSVTYTGWSEDGSYTTLQLDPTYTGDVYGGYTYTTKYTPSMPKILDYKDRVINTDRLTLTRFLISYKHTGYFKTLVQHPYYDDLSQEYNARTVGESQNIVGANPIDTGVFRASVRRNVEDCDFTVYTDSYLPLVLTDFEWVAQYNKRGKRV